MPDTQFNQQSIVRFFQRLSLGQKLLISVVTVGTAIALVVLVSFVNQPSYGTLFSNLNTQDASKIVEKLKEKKVPYTIDDAGKTILVPKQQIYDLRLALAGEGIPQSSIIGYEIFDRTNLGVSDFVQKVNYRRALEGELARTILQIEEVEAARVHIVVPEKSLFKEDEKPPTASVILKLRSGRTPKREVIQGISHLIASSVEGLETNNVSIVDSRGILLSDNTKSNSLAALSSTQYEMQQKVESYLAQKAQGLLDGVLGTGNSFLQVNAELDFRQVDRTLEQYDGANPAVRSEQTTEERSATRDSLPPSSRSNSITNYELNKTIEHIIENVGNVKRLSVAALINNKPVPAEKNGEKSTQYVARTPQEMDQLSDIIKKAVGFDVQRNDEVSVVNFPFSGGDRQDDFMYKESPNVDWRDLIDKGVMVLAMAGAIMIVWMLLRRLRVKVAHEFDTMLGDPAIAELQSKIASAPRLEQEVAPEALARAERQQRILQYVNEKPEEASRLLKVWLAEES